MQPRFFCTVLLASIFTVSGAQGAEARNVCAKADSLLAAKAFALARQAYIAELSKAPGLPCAIAGLENVAEIEKRNGLSRVRLLESLGLYEEALAALKELARQDPAVLTSIPDDLQYLSGGKIGRWRALRRQIEPTGRPLGEILAILALLLFIFVWSYFRWFKPPSLELSFDDSALDKELAKGFTALMNDALKRLATGAPGLRVGLVTGPIEPVSIPAEITQAIPPAISWVNIVPVLLAKLSPRRLLSLSGQLHIPGELGAGVTLVLSERKNVLSSLTIWQSQFDPSNPPTVNIESKAYYALAEPAAIWLLFELAEHARPAV